MNPLAPTLPRLHPHMTHTLQPEYRGDSAGLGSEPPQPEPHCVASTQPALLSELRLPLLYREEAGLELLWFSLCWNLSCLCICPSGV